MFARNCDLCAVARSAVSRAAGAARGAAIARTWSPRTAGVVRQGRAGALTALWVQAERRVAALPQVRTVGEAGLPGFYTQMWHALWAPAGTPKDAIARLNAAFDDVPQGVVLCDATGREILRNHAAGEFAGARHAEALVEQALFG